MTKVADPIARVIEELRKLPGIGPKSAQRLAFYLVRGADEECQRLAQAISQLKAGLALCSLCNNVPFHCRRAD